MGLSKKVRGGGLGRWNLAQLCPVDKSPALVFSTKTMRSPSDGPA